MEWDLTFREYVAVANVVVLSYFTAVLLTNISDKYLYLRRRGADFRSLWDDPLTQGAIALAVMNGGDVAYRVWVWMILKVYNDGSSNLWVKQHWPAAMVASVAIVLGGLCAIRVFSLHGWSTVNWVGCVALLLLAFLLNYLI